MPGIRPDRPSPWFALALAVVFGVGVAACSDDSDDPAKPKQEAVLDVGIDDQGNGACLLVPEDFGAKVDKLPVIDCALPHTHEIFAEIEYRGPAGEEVDVYPGDSALDEFATRECAKAFEDYVDINVFDSKLAPTWLRPTLDGWNDKDDKTIVCVLTDPTQEMLVGSVRGSGK